MSASATAGALLAPVAAAEDGKVKVHIAPERAVEACGGELHMLVRVATPAGDARAPTDICCVIDISGSMDAAAKVQGAGGANESTGLSLLDVAKHGVKTVIHTLGPLDRISIVWFNHASGIALPLTAMDEAGRKLAEEKLNELGVCGTTNLWEGLEKGLQALHDGAVPGRFSHMMLLTDGRADDKNRVLPNLEAYKGSHEGLPGTINTFGFGYSLDSDLLCKVANFGDGSYGFIPDAGFVGTLFVNSMSNLLTSMGRGACLAVEADAGTKILGVLGSQAVETDRSGITRVHLGTLQCGQSKDVVVRVSAPTEAGPYLCASVEYIARQGEKVRVVAEACTPGDATDFSLVEPQRCRCLFVEAIARAIEASRAGTDEGIERARSIVQATADVIEASQAAPLKEVAALLEDARGQSTEAFSSGEVWRRWGVHYMPSVMFAHRRQQCNNFKDPGVQFYGGSLFESIRDAADETFNALPPPARGRRHSSFGIAPASMAVFNDRYGGCIDGASLAQLAGGEARRISELSKGDLVAAPGGTAEVVCVVRTMCPSGTRSLVELPGGARLTPYHPVLFGGEWRFPADLATVVERSCNAVYSLVLAGAPALLVGGVPCVALGHGLQEGAAAHAYFGSRRVLDDLAALPGYAEGHVDLRAGCEARDPETGLVCGLRV